MKFYRKQSNYTLPAGEVFLNPYKYPIIALTCPMNEHISIKNWNENDRPREKLLQKGPSALSDAELLGLLISTGTKDKSAVDLMKEVLQLANYNLRELGRLQLTEIQQVKGIGEAKAIIITAAMELGRRRQISDVLNRKTVTNSADAADIFMAELSDLNHERFMVMYLNTANKILDWEKISDGGLASTIADIRIILKKALLKNAPRIIIAHNHPSGNRTASTADITLTNKLNEACNLLDITLLDHIIIAGNSYLSCKDEGLF